jgi:hypothetical protein
MCEQNLRVSRIGRWRGPHTSGSTKHWRHGRGILRHCASFTYQGLAGTTCEPNESAETFGGVRYFDALDAEVVNIEIDTDNINFEVGLRYFF